MSKITPCLWFDGQAEEAMNLYCSIFKDSKPGKVSRYPEGGPMPAGTVITAEFTLFGQDYLALNGGPLFKFTEAVSFQIHTADQAETDWYWTKLIEGGGEPSQCGWLKDKFGLSWQVTPTRLTELMMGPDRDKAARVMGAMMKMGKIVIADLEAAANAVPA